MTIHIEDLRFKCIIGLLEFERHTPQEIIVALELDYDYTDTFINYAELAGLIEAHLQEKKYELLETALNELFETISTQYSLITRLFIKITKPDILPNCRVCVSNVKFY
jgi:7,8-dihydroneopterin aldolase/epimerase/oxygenase